CCRRGRSLPAHSPDICRRRRDMPGRLLHRMPIWFCDDRSRRHVIEPLLADVQREWESRRSLLALRRGYAAYWLSLALCFARCLATPPDRELARRSFLPFVAAACAPMALRLVGMRFAMFAMWGWRGTFLLAVGAVGFSPAFAMLPSLMRARSGPR